MPHTDPIQNAPASPGDFGENDVRLIDNFLPELKHQCVELSQSDLRETSRTR